MASKAAAPWRVRHFIDSHKAATIPWVLALMAAYGAWSQPAAWAYLAMHGTYALLWLLKSASFPDRQWEAEIPPWRGVGIIWTLLSLYWVAPWLLVKHAVAPPPWYLAACIALFGTGVFLHFVSDMQKHVQLALRPGKLVTDGLFARCRNINYFGELLLYMGFQLLAMHWLPIALMAFMVVSVWLPNMLKKDQSLSRYPDFAAWKARTALFIPYLF